MTVTEPTRTTLYDRDALGQVLTKTIRDNATLATRTWTYTYGTVGSAKGQVTQIDGPRTDVADITTFEYDVNGGLNKITDALGHITTLVNDVNGRPLTITDPNGLITQITYDARGQVLTVTEGQEATIYTRDKVGQVIQVTLPSGAYLKYGYDDAHRLTSVTDALVNKIIYTLDGMGNIRKTDVKDSTGVLVQTQTKVYDTVNRVKTLIGANPNEITSI